MCARQGDQSGIISTGQRRTADFGSAMTAHAEISIAEQFAQTQIAGAILCQQQQAAGVFALRIVGSISAACAMFAGDPHIATDDRLDAGATRRRIKLDHAKQIAEIGQRQCGHALGHGARNNGIKADNAVSD